MKLIDLLVQELPKRGGWPDGAVECCRHYGTNSIDFYDETGNWDDDCYLKYGKDFAKDCIYEETSGSHRLQSISRSEYEEAIAASQKSSWNGEGLPPVGCECEARLRCNDGEWFFFRCVGVDCGVAFGWAGKEAVTLGKGSYEFRPLRTEVEKKRDAFINAVLDDMRVIPCDLSLRDEVAVIYDAIAAGKIPGVKLDD